MFKHRWNSIHAEQSAIMKVLKQPEGLSSLAGSTLYVTRINKKGVAMSKPCDVCMELIRATGIKRIIYTISNDETGVLNV